MGVGSISLASFKKHLQITARQISQQRRDLLEKKPNIIRCARVTVLLGESYGRNKYTVLRHGRGSSMTADDDKQLVERVQKGDKRAFDLLVLKYQSRIMALVVRFVHDQHEAQDVTQEAFIKAYRALGNFRGDSAFYTWLYRIAINTAKNYLVSRNRRPPSTDVDAGDAEFYEGEHALKNIDTPERLLMRDEVDQALQKSISKLPEDLRVALTMREYEGLSYEDIAIIMQCPVGTVRSRIFRAREAVNNALQPLLEA